MNTPLQQPSRKMTVDEFLVWAEQQPGRGYELLDGEVVGMAPERSSRNEVKLRIAMRLFQAVEEARTDCQVFTDGLSYAVDESTTFEPDAMVRCGPKLDGSIMVVTDPVIVVEVLSPSTQIVDSTIKLDRYFRVPSVQHYLILSTSGPPYVHHRRAADGISTHIVPPGPLRFDPPA